MLLSLKIISSCTELSFFLKKMIFIEPQINLQMRRAIKANRFVSIYVVCRVPCWLH